MRREEDGRLRVEEEEVGMREQVGRMKELRLPLPISLLSPSACLRFLSCSLLSPPPYILPPVSLIIYPPPFLPQRLPLLLFSLLSKL